MEPCNFSASRFIKIKLRFNVNQIDFLLKNLDLSDYTFFNNANVVMSVWKTEFCSIFSAQNGFTFRKPCKKYTV